MRQVSMTSPTKMPIRDAAARYDLASRLPALDDYDAVTVYAGPAQLDELDLDETGPCLVAGDLTVTGDIVGMNEEGGFLVVLGRCTARNLLLGGPCVWIDSDLVVENGVLADYNHGMLTVVGDLTARILSAEHVVKVKGGIRGTSIDFGGLRVEDPAFVPTLSRTQAVHEAKEHFVPEALNDRGYVSGARLRELMREGAAILRER